MKPAIKSLWSDAVSADLTTTRTLEGEHQADVTIIGAGFCGLSAALHLAKAGVKVVCLEAETIGWGASGRNNGQVIAGLKRDPEQVIKQLGAERAQPLIQCSGEAPDLVFSLIKQYGIDCDAVQKGWIQVGRSDKSIKEMQSRVSQWQEFGAPVEMLEPDQLSKRLGTDWYKAGWIDKRGGSLNPLAYACGLAAAS
ncbi:MAG: FAD-dependent oxidoreductase, partial [Gammaproteobacteria bacterium]